MDRDERALFFSHMAGCCHALYLWTFDSTMRLLSHDGPYRATQLFSTEEQQMLLNVVKASPMPTIFTTELHLSWIAVSHWENGLPERVYALGPFFMEDHPLEDLSPFLQRRGLTRAESAEIVSQLRTLSVLSLGRIFEYAIMLHYCITEERITVSDLNYHEQAKKPRAKKNSAKTVDMHGTYALEREMLRMVREGDPRLQEQINRLAVSGTMGKLSNGDPSRQMKNAVLVNLSLFSRAAIDGGLSPEVSLTIADSYFQSIEACRSISELREIAVTMQNDYAERVRRVRMEGYSKPIAACCDYIRLHLEEDLTLKLLAERIRYSEYYLSRRFKEEVGTTVKEYIVRCRLEHAIALLADPAVSIRDVSAQLHFCSQSYFTECFRAHYGMTPHEWRNRLDAP